MKTSRFIAAFLMSATFAPLLQAGVFDFLKSNPNCDNSTCTTVVERPVIVRPTSEIVRTYQRGFAERPMSCDTCAPGTGCTPDSAGHCVAWPIGPVEIEVSCTGFSPLACDSELAALIVESKTAAYARHRRLAIHKIGQRFNCATCPHVMPALVYALNDCDESVRAKAADKIGDQLRRNPGCCSPYIVCALKMSLHDYDIQVRSQAEQALILCGYQIVSPSLASSRRGSVSHVNYDSCILPVSYPASQPNYSGTISAPVEIQPYVPPRQVPSQTVPKPSVPQGLPVENAFPVPARPEASNQSQSPRGTLKEPIPLAGISDEDGFMPPVPVR